MYKCDGNFKTITQFNDPWKFWVVDDFLDQETYDYLVSNREQFPYTFLDRHKKKFEKVGYFFEEQYDARVLGAINAAVVKAIGKHELTVVSEIVRCEPEYKYPTHNDHPDKLYTIVTYLHPEQGNGTFLVSDEIGEPETEVVWKPNRALIFKQNPNAPHYYLNDTKENRYTINTFLTKQNIRFKTQKSS